MPSYRRWYVPGGTFFFTLVTNHRRPLLQSELARRCLREAIHEELGQYTLNWVAEEPTTVSDEAEWGE